MAAWSVILRFIDDDGPDVCPRCGGLGEWNGAACGMCDSDGIIVECGDCFGMGCIVCRGSGVVPHISPTTLH